MSSLPVVRVTIPTYNCAAALDATVQSVLAQDYAEEKIVILFADFGSTDGTLEKIAGYRREWTGMFSLAGRRIGRTMAAEALSLWSLQGVPGSSLLLRPGDVLYPHCFSTCARWLRFAKRQPYATPFLAMEVDIREPDGQIRCQTPLFTSPCLLRAYSEDSLEYVKKGYRHAALTFGQPCSIMKDKPSTLSNLDFWWNSLAYRGFFSNVLYLDEALGCLAAKEPEDELDEILFSFEQVLTMSRMTKELPDTHVADDLFEPSARFQLAKRALWRAFILHGRGRHKDAEDCFLLARVICPAMADEECWRAMKRLLESGDLSVISWLDAYFAREEKPDKPKWPLGGTFVQMAQRLRRLCSREKKSKFSDW